MRAFILIAICIRLAQGYPDGAPTSACPTMLPGHDVDSLQCHPNYVIQADKVEFDANEVVRITVRGVTKDDHFKGILLVARPMAANQDPIGTWSTAASSIKTIACHDRENSGISHASPEDKLQIEAMWHAPASVSEENTIIQATIVKSFGEIYVNCFNLTLKSKQKRFSTMGSVKTLEAAKTNTNVTWTFANHTVTVNMQTGSMHVNEWRSIGFSLDQQMGDEHIFICQVSATGDASLRRMHTKLGKRPPSATKDEVHVIRTAYVNGHTTCEFSFKTNSEQVPGEPAPLADGKDYHLLFAAGHLANEERVMKHNSTFVSTKTYQLEKTERLDLDEMPTMMTTSKPTALSTGPTITSTIASLARDVGVNVRWSYANSVTTVQMNIENLKASQWVALGLSLDDKMGEDHVFVCQHLADNTVLLQRFVNPSGKARPVLATTIANAGGMFNVSRQTLDNNLIKCDFTLSNFVDAKRRTRQNRVLELSQTVDYRPLIAIGNIDGSSEYIATASADTTAVKTDLDSLVRHSPSSRSALSQKVALNRQETISYNADSTSSDPTRFMKAHGIIMIFTWIVLVSTGILVARYFKASSPDRKICGKAVWFAVHRTLMSCAATLTVIAFVLILFYKKGQWTSKSSAREFTHSIVGLIVIIFAMIQPFMALFRCSPDGKYRFIFNYAHATVGSTAFILSITAIFLAMFFTQFNFQVTREWTILVAWSCWLPVVFVLFEIIEVYFRRLASSAIESNSYDLSAFHQSALEKMDAMNMPYSIRRDRIKALLLLLHIFIAVGLALALAILIGRL